MKNHSTEQPTFDEFMSAIEKARAEGGVDLTMAEDLSLAVMNLVALEEHFYFTALKTGKDGYHDTAADVREMRKRLLRELMPHHEGETWCASKHLLSATMRLIETGNKLHSAGERDRARNMFADAYRVYSIFWALKLKLIEAKEAGASVTAPEGTAGTRSTAGAQAGKAAKIENLVAELAKCCEE